MNHASSQGDAWPLPTLPPPAARPTWNDWLRQQEHRAHRDSNPPAAAPFSERELARLRFQRWLYETGCLTR